MVDITSKKLENYFEQFKTKKILVIGDVMLDHYMEGIVNRISPEAPVPVVEVKNEYTRLGGAANVAFNLASLGAQPQLIGIIGTDQSGQELKKIMARFNFSTDYIFADADRPTAVKTRIIAHDQHVVRADRESKEKISPEIFQVVLKAIDTLLPASDAVLIEDYNKGLLTAELIGEIISRARKFNKIITVDPKFDNFFAYQQVTLFKPNRKEIEAALGIRISSVSELEKACSQVIDQLQCQFVLITLGEHGMCLMDAGRNFRQLPTRARKVHDVSGAGDTVISTLTLALAAGANIQEAITLANYAAGAVCGEVGVVPITPQMLRKEFDEIEKKM